MHPDCPMFLTFLSFHPQDNREAMDKIVEELMEKETLTGDEFRALLAQYVTIPEENLKAAAAKDTLLAPAAAFEKFEL